VAFVKTGWAGLIIITGVLLQSVCRPALAVDEQAAAFSKLAEMLQLSPDSSEYQNLQLAIQSKLKALIHVDYSAPERVERAGSDGMAGGASDIDKPLDEALSQMTLIKHQKSEDGLPFPAVQPTLSPDAAKDPAAEQAMSHFTEAMVASAKQLTERPALPACEQSAVMKREYVAEKNMGQVFAPDFLFLRGVEPRDADELFGVTVQVVTCSDRPGDGCALIAEQFGLECLPTRVRVQNDELYRLEGEAALKNYDVKSTGAMHPLVKKNIKSYLGG